MRTTGFERHIRLAAITACMGLMLGNAPCYHFRYPPDPRYIDRDLNCEDIPTMVRIVGEDEHHLDRDGDLLAC